MSTPSTPPPAPRTWVYGTLPWLEEADRLTGTAPRTRVVVSRLREDDPWNRTDSSVRTGRERVEGLLGAMGVTGVGLHDGDDRGFDAHDGPTDASRFIVAEAMRDDDRPLYLVAGGSLGDVARAYRAEPAIAERLTLIWIGGSEHAGTARAPEGTTALEYNMALDVAAAMHVFNETDARIWQMPRDVYRSAAVSLPVIRRYRRIDNNLLFDDMFASFQALAEWLGA